MKTKIFLMYLMMTLIFGLCSEKNAMAAPQVFIQQYGFTEGGTLKQQLVVNFDNYTSKEINATLTPSGNNRTLVIAFPLKDKIFTKILTNGYNYALYKLSLRRPEKQELLILAQGKKETGKTLLRGVTIIGTNDLGVVEELPISGFKEVKVLNSPLQLRSNKTAVLFKAGAKEMVVIDWNETTKVFDILGTN